MPSRSFRNDNVKVTGEFRRESDGAVLLMLELPHDKEMWFPKSQCEFDPAAPWYHGQEVTAELPKWLAEKKELD